MDMNMNCNIKTKIPTIKFPLSKIGKPSKGLREYVRNLQQRMDMYDCKEMHGLILKSGLEQNVYLGSKLVSMYAKCCKPEDARQVFDKMTGRNFVSWTAMINGYAKNCLHDEALSLYFEMKSEGTCPNNLTFSSVLKACAGSGALEHGKLLHVEIIKRGFLSYVSVGSALVDMYAKCGRIEDARQVFEEMSERDVVTWNTIIWGMVENGKAKEALRYFFRMLDDHSVKPNSNIVVSIVKACTHLAALKWGKEIHALIMKTDLESNAFVGSALVAMYALCKRPEASRRIFDRISQTDSVVLWNAMIAAYSQNGYANEALELFCQMHQNAVNRDAVTIAGVLPACANLGCLKIGKEIHCYVIRNRIECDVFVSSALIDMYAKCGCIDAARRVFDEESEKDVISWTAIIAGYGMNGHHREAMKCFHQMQKEGLKPNGITYVALLSTL